jgi:hypothetical protein
MQRGIKMLEFVLYAGLFTAWIATFAAWAWLISMFFTQ